jgi:hypothetical protein
MLLFGGFCFVRLPPRHSKPAPASPQVLPSLPDTRLEIRQRRFHIHSRHPLAKHRMIQFKPVLIHDRHLSAQPEPDNQIYATKQLTPITTAHVIAQKIAQAIRPTSSIRVSGTVCALRSPDGCVPGRLRVFSHDLATFSVTSVTSGA